MNHVALHSRPQRYISLFAGYAGLNHALRAAFPSAVCKLYVENDAKAAELLVTRAAQGCIDDAPIFGDIGQFNGTEFVEDVGEVDGIVGGFPCTDLSVAGDREGIVEGNASGLWFEFARIIREVRPRWVFVENVSGILVPHSDTEEAEWVLPAGLWFVLGALSELGFDAAWGTLRADSVGAAQERNRTFILACRRGERCNGNGQQHSFAVQSEQFAPRRQYVNGCDSEMVSPTLRGFGELRQSSPGAELSNRTGTQLEHASRQLGANGGSGRRGVCKADQTVGITSCAQRRPNTAAGARSDQGFNAGGEAASGIGDAGAILEPTDAQLAEPAIEGLPQRRDQPGDCGETSGEPPAERRGLELFPPGQGTWTRWFVSPDGRAFRVAKDEDARAWSRIVRESPWLDPATQPGVRLLAHGTSLLVDESKTDQLRMLGNGVVPLQAAATLVELDRRLGGVI